MIIKIGKYITTAILGLSLVACNSDETIEFSNAVGGGKPTPPPADATLVSVTVPPVTALWKIPQQLKATATYDDGSSVELTDSNVTWELLNASASEVALTATGKITVANNSVSGGTVRATVNGIPSEESPVSVSTLAGAFIDIVDAGNGKLFTSSPSKAYLDSIGGSASNGSYTENGMFGPAGEFYLFDWANANTLCTTYNTKSLGGRTNWRLAEKNELVELYGKFGNMSNARGWPTSSLYWSATATGSLYFTVDLFVGDVYNNGASFTTDASCVSNP